MERMSKHISSSRSVDVQLLQLSSLKGTKLYKFEVRNVYFAQLLIVLGGEHV